jgi:hypothetical protein
LKSRKRDGVRQTAGSQNVLKSWPKQKSAQYVRLKQQYMNRPNSALTKDGPILFKERKMALVLISMAFKMAEFGEIHQNSAGSASLNFQNVVKIGGNSVKVDRNSLKPDGFSHLRIFYWL